MKIAFRVDSSSTIGAGHVRRCLKLAEDLRNKSAKIIFITKKLHGNFNSLIKKKKFKIILIKDFKSKNKLSKDFIDTKNICKTYKINTLIVDHYYLSPSWEKKIKENINKLVIIDDFTKTKHYCDLIINNLSKKNLNKTKNLTGLKYVIIPKNFLKKKAKIKKKTKHLTIGTFFGSTDKINCSERLLKTFSQKEFNNYKFITILGKNNKKKNKIYENFSKYKNLKIEKRFIKMNNFFKKIDVLITVGGVTSFEALCNNVKCIYIPINHYQKMTCQFLQKKKVPNIFSYNEIFSKKGKNLLINCFKKILKEGKLSNKYFDNLGSQRIADYILNKNFNKNIIGN